MSEILNEARKWGAVFAAIERGLASIGEQISAGARLAREAMDEEARARIHLGSGLDLTEAIERARVVSRETRLSYPAALRREVDLILNPPRADLAGTFGYHVLAEVIRNQEGRQIVRDGMRDIRVWLGEEPARPHGARPVNADLMEGDDG